MFILVREHPYLSGTLLVVLLILLFLIFRRRSDGGGQAGGVTYVGASEGLQAAQISAGTAIQQTQIAANVRTMETNAQLQATALLSAADVQKSFFAQQVELEKIYGSVDFGKYQIDAQKQVALAQLGQQQPLPVPVSNTPVVSTPTYSGPLYAPPTASGWVEYLGPKMIDPLSPYGTHAGCSKDANGVEHCGSYPAITQAAFAGATFS